MTVLIAMSAGLNLGLLLCLILLWGEVRMLRKSLPTGERLVFNQLCATNRRLMGILMVLRWPGEASNVIRELGFDPHTINPGTLREAAKDQPDFNGILERDRS